MHIFIGLNVREGKDLATLADCILLGSYINSGRYRGLSEGKCHNCGKTDHKSRDCRAQSGGSYKGEGGGNLYANIECYLS